MVLMSADNDPEGGARRRLQLQDAAEDPVVPARDRRRRPGVPADQRPRRRVGRAGDGEEGGRRVRRHREDDRRPPSSLYGPYRWDRYDILVLPPSFPYGGMENPRLTFATPTVIVGDKSLVSLIAHELAHSWSGNLVTFSSAEGRAGSTKASPATSRTASSRTLYGKEARRHGERDRAQRARRRVTRKSIRSCRCWRCSPGALTDPDEQPAARPSTPRARGSCSSWSSASAARRSIRSCASYFDHFAFQIDPDARSSSTYAKANLLDKYPGKVTEAEFDAWLYEPGVPATAPQDRVARASTRSTPRARPGSTAARCRDAALTAKWTHAGMGALHRRHAARR